MERTPYFRVAISGSAWFAFVAASALPLLMIALPRPLAPGTLHDTGSHFRFALLMFGPPAATIGFALSNRIAHSASYLTAFGLGVAVVLLTSLLAGVVVSVLGSHFASLRLSLEDAVLMATSFLLLDILLFKGATFMLGGLAAMAFRAGIQRVGWA